MELAGLKQGSLRGGGDELARDDPEDSCASSHSCASSSTPGFPKHVRGAQSGVSSSGFELDCRISPKRVREAENGKISGDCSLDRRICSALDEHLQEKIIAKLPFKKVFQAASLSKAWRLTLRRPSFQREAETSMTSWNSYAPLFVNSQQGLVGYESGSKRWHRLPSHSFLEHVEGNWFLKAGHGSLLCWLTSSDRRQFHIVVSNPLTKSWRQLPHGPDLSAVLLLVVWEGGDAYKVIVGSLSSPSVKLADKIPISLQIFDSTSGSWSEELYCINGSTSGAELRSRAVVRGVVYMLLSTPIERYNLISFDLKERTWKRTYLSQVFYNVRFADIFACRSKVMLVMCYSTIVGNNFNETLSVLELDLESGVAVEVSKAPKEMLAKIGFEYTSVQGDSMYLGRQYGKMPIVVYNVETREWDWLSDRPPRFDKTGREDCWESTSVTYQPGLNAFLQV